MKIVGIKDLKNHLSRYVRLAEAGETVLVTDRDRVVAELGPPGDGRRHALSNELPQDAIRRGLITPPKFISGALPMRKPVMKIDELMQDLKHDRSDR